MVGRVWAAIIVTVVAMIFLACGDGADRTPSGSPSVTAPVGTTLARVPDDPAALVEKLRQPGAGEERCGYDESTKIADCGARGSYFTDPGITGRDAFCILTLRDGKPQALTCRSASPPQSRLYGILD